MATLRNLISKQKGGTSSDVTPSIQFSTGEVKVIISTRMRISRHPYLKGFSSLSGLSDSKSVLNEYMRGNDYTDMLRDWQCVGHDMRIAISEVVK